MPGISTPNVCRAVISRARSYAKAKGLPLKTVFRSMGLLEAGLARRVLEKRMQSLKAKGLLGNEEALDLYLGSGIRASAKRTMKCRLGDELVLYRDKKESLYEEEAVLEEMWAAEKHPEPPGWSHGPLGREPIFHVREDKRRYEDAMWRHEQARSRYDQIKPEAERILRERGVFGKVEELGWEKVLYQEMNAILQEIGALHDQIMSEALGVLDQRKPFVPLEGDRIPLRTGKAGEAGEEKQLGGSLAWIEGFDRRDIPTILKLARGNGHYLSFKPVGKGRADGYLVEVEPRHKVPSGAEIRMVSTEVRNPDHEKPQIKFRQIMYNGIKIFERTFSEEGSLEPQ